MKKLVFYVSILLISLNCYSQLTNKQGISSINIRPSGSFITFGLPQSSTLSNGFQQGVLSYFPYPLSSFPVNASTNRQGKTSFTGLIGTFDLGLNITKLLQNDRIIRGELGVYYACIPHSYSIDDKFQYNLNAKQSSFLQNTVSYSGLMGSLMYTTKSRGRRIWGEARDYIQLGLRTMNYLEQSLENQEDWTLNGNGFKIQSELINKKSFLIFAELGRTYWRKADDMRSLEMGVRVGIPTKSFTKNTITGFTNNQPIGGNEILENGAFISFQVSYNLPIIQLQK